MEEHYIFLEYSQSHPDHCEGKLRRKVNGALIYPLGARGTDCRCVGLEWDIIMPIALF
jgi:hypothetical protein